MRLAAAAVKAHVSTSFRNAPANRSMFDIAHEGDVAILRMARGKANAMNIELCSALSQYLAEFRTSQARALVITGPGIFSPGSTCCVCPAGVVCSQIPAGLERDVSPRSHSLSRSSPRSTAMPSPAAVCWPARPTNG
jgi:hypothetical protein